MIAGPRRRQLSRRFAAIKCGKVEIGAANATLMHRASVSGPIFIDPDGRPVCPHGALGLKRLETGMERTDLTVLGEG